MKNFLLRLLHGIISTLLIPYWGKCIFAATVLLVTGLLTDLDWIGFIFVFASTGLSMIIINFLIMLITMAYDRWKLWPMAIAMSVPILVLVAFSIFEFDKLYQPENTSDLSVDAYNIVSCFFIVAILNTMFSLFVLARHVIIGEIIEQNREVFQH